MMAEQVRLYYSVERKMTFLRGDTPLKTASLSFYLQTHPTPSLFLSELIYISIPCDLPHTPKVDNTHAH